MRLATQPPPYEGGRWAVLMSFFALMISAFSLYETSLKQAKPTIHVGGMIRYAQDALQPVDVFILPVTIKNSGARDMMVLELTLRVARAGPDAPVWTEMIGRYFGSNPRDDKMLFTPISVPGKSSQAATILFYRESATEGAPGALVNGNHGFRFCLTARLAASEDFEFLGEPAPPRVSFDAEVIAFGKEDLLAGRTVDLRVRNAKQPDAAKTDPEAAPGC